MAGRVNKGQGCLFNQLPGGTSLPLSLVAQAACTSPRTTPHAFMHPTTAQPSPHTFMHPTPSHPTPHTLPHTRPCTPPHPTPSHIRSCPPPPTHTHTCTCTGCSPTLRLPPQKVVVSAAAGSSPSRGALPVSFLDSDLSPQAFMQALDLSTYASCNLVVADLKDGSALFSSNRGQPGPPVKLDRGKIYGGRMMALCGMECSGFIGLQGQDIWWAHAHDGPVRNGVPQGLEGCKAPPLPPHSE